MSPSRSAQRGHSELVAIATAMLEDRMHLIEGARKICEIRQSVEDPEAEVFMPIRGFESETDDFPLGEARAHCAADYLKQVDREMDEYIAEARQDVLSACRDLVRHFS